MNGNRAVQPDVVDVTSDMRLWDYPNRSIFIGDFFEVDFKCHYLPPCLIAGNHAGDTSYDCWPPKRWQLARVVFN